MVPLISSNGFKHATNQLQIIKNEVDHNEKTMPLRVHIECDGGSYHNINNFQNQAALFSIFLKGNMDYLIAYGECHGLSYLLTCERVMSLLTLSTATLALSVKPNEPKWLFSDVLEKQSSMKTVRVAVHQYDEAVPFSIARLEQMLGQVKKKRQRVTG